MNKNWYDTDCVTWSPQGRIFQIEYAGEAVKQGTCVVAVKNGRHAVLVGLRRSISALADENDKVLKIDEHVGMAFSGITADANIILTAMRKDCLNQKFMFDTPAPVKRLVDEIADRSQRNTVKYGRRPFGVGVLIAGYDTQGPQIFETTPSGEYHEHFAAAFGSRCQAARTFLEDNLEAILATEDEESLMAYALKALVSAYSADQEVSGRSIHLGAVGKDTPWKTLATHEVDALIEKHGVARPTVPAPSA